MPNHPNRRRPSVARCAATIGYELSVENRWHDSDAGRYFARWRLRKEGSPYARDTDYFETLADVDQRLDIEESRRN